MQTTTSLRDYLKQNKIKPADFARKVRVTERSIYNYMNGKYPTRKTEQKIKKVTGIDIKF